MTEQDRNDFPNGVTGAGALQRMAGRRRAEAEKAQATMLAALRLAFGRMGADCAGLDAVVQGVTLSEGALAEVLDLAESGMLYALLEGPKERMGLIMVDAAVLAGIIEAQTTGLVIASPVSPRKPTRTDAALLAPMIEAFLQQVAQCCAGLPCERQVTGFVYGSFQNDPRPLGLMLEDGTYTIVKLSVALGFGAKAGNWFLIIPQGGAELDQLAPDEPASEQDDDWKARLEFAINSSPVTLDAVLCRLQISLTDVLRLRVGDILRVPDSALESLTLETLDQATVSEGRLGQARGQRAVRLTTDIATAVSSTTRTLLPANVLPLRPEKPVFNPTKAHGQLVEKADFPNESSEAELQSHAMRSGSGLP